MEILLGEWNGWELKIHGRFANQAKACRAARKLWAKRRRAWMQNDIHTNKPTVIIRGGGTWYELDWHLYASVENRQAYIIKNQENEVAVATFGRNS